MADRTLPYWWRTALATAALAASIPLTLGTVPASAPAPASASTPGIDWNAVGRVIGTPLKTETGDVHTAEWLRTDLRVVNAGVTENPGMELGTEAMFHRSTVGQVVVIGEFTLTESEVDKVTDRLQRGGVLVTALHKHLQDESPRLWWLHYAAYGDPLTIARTLHAALALIGTPLHQQKDKEPLISLDTAALDRIIGAKGSNEHGVWQFHIPVTQKVTDTRAHLTLPYLMEASTLLMFQPLGGGRAAINGDFAMTADQVNPVINALRSHGLTVIEVHNHMLFEQPRLFYLHFWATGQATILARALRAGLKVVS